MLTRIGFERLPDGSDSLQVVLREHRDGIERGWREDALGSLEMAAKYRS